MTQNLAFCPPTLAAWAQDVESDEEPTFIIDDVIPHDALVLLSGEPKDAMKTWLAMKLAIVAATGRSEANLTCQAPVPVLYIYREGARKPTLRRFQALLHQGPFSTEHLDNFFFHHRGGFFLDDAEAVGEVVKFVMYHGIKLVVVDTFAKSCRADENSAREMGMAIQQVDKIRDAGATVLLVHHLRKGAHSLSAGKSGTPEPDKDIRGSTAIAGAYEMHLAVRSFPVAGQREKEAVLMVGGKEADWVSFSYQWEFENENEGAQDESLRTVTLHLEKQKLLPFIEAPRSRGRGDDDGDNCYV